MYNLFPFHNWMIYTIYVLDPMHHETPSPADIVLSRS